MDVIVDVIDRVIVDVDDRVIVAALVSGNDTVEVIDAVDSKHRRMETADRKRLTDGVRFALPRREAERS